MMIKELTCIVCPVGCHLKVDLGNDHSVSENKCERGIEYGRQELINPKRMVTSTIIIEGGIYKRLPVKTSASVTKNLIFDVMKEINKIKVKSPVKMGDVILYNILGTGFDILASRDM